MSAPPTGWSGAIAAAYLRHRIEGMIGKHPKFGASADLARKLGISPATLSVVQLGTRASVGIGTFDAFARLFGVTHDVLLDQAHGWIAKNPKALPAATPRRAKPDLSDFTTAELLAEIGRRAK